METEDFDVWETGEVDPGVLVQGLGGLVMVAAGRSV